MGRQRKGPWRRARDGRWVTSPAGGKGQVVLAEAHESYDVAFQRFVEFHANGPLQSVAQIIDRFLEWVQQNRAPRTYEWYRDHLRRFYQHHGDGLSVAKLKPHHVNEWIAAHYQGRSANYRRMAIRTIKRAMNWAVTEGYIETSPIARMEMPRQEARETTITEEQFRQMIDLTTDQQFRDYLTFIWETGCRAEEICVIAAKHFDGETITLTKKDSKGKKHNRVIYPTDAALEIVKRLAAKHPTGPIFRNSQGEPWGKNAVRCRFRKLKRDMGILDLCATTLRHSWATLTLKNGEVDTTTASILMGHRDPSTLARNYQHLTQDRDYLKEAARRARGAGSQNGDARERDQASSRGQESEAQDRDSES